MEIKGKFISIWDDGIEICTDATLDTETGEVFTNSVDVNNLEVLIEEFFRDEEGYEDEICPFCHTHILKIKVVEGVGKSLEEVYSCSNENCENF